MPDLNVLDTPHPFDILPVEEVIAVADRLFDQVLAAVTTEAFVPVRQQAVPPGRG